jgi:DNA-binding GntR family transcriptional regulator
MRYHAMENLQDLGTTPPLKDQVYRIIKLQIILGKLKPGSRISMLELATAMNVSRAPVREALSMLNKDGLVTIVPRKQAFVSEVSRKDLQMIADLRLMLEPYAARKSTPLIPEEKLREVEQKLQHVLDNPSDFAAYVNSDLEFHELLYTHTGYNLLKDIMLMVKQHSLRLRYLAEEEESNRKDIVVRSTQEHLDILRAAKERNAERVSELVAVHLRNANARALSSQT